MAKRKTVQDLERAREIERRERRRFGAGCKAGGMNPRRYTRVVGHLKAMERSNLAANFDVTYAGNVVRFWNVITQGWDTRSAAEIPNTLLATLPHADRERIQMLQGKG